MSVYKGGKRVLESQYDDPDQPVFKIKYPPSDMLYEKSEYEQSEAERPKKNFIMKNKQLVYQNRRA